MTSLIATPDIAPESGKNLLYIPKRAMLQLAFSKEGNPKAISYEIQKEVAEKIISLNPEQSFVLSRINMNNNMHANDYYTDSGVFSLPKNHKHQDNLMTAFKGSANKIPGSEALASIQFPPETKRYVAPQEHLDAIASLKVKHIEGIYNIFTERKLSPQERDILSSIGTIGRCFALVEVSFGQERYGHTIETDFEKLIQSN